MFRYTWTFFSILPFVFGGAVCDLGSADRLGRPVGQDEGSVHVMGNGDMCVYERGPHVITVYSNPYSSPAFFQLLMPENSELSTISVREPGMAVWTHRLMQDQQCKGEMVDFVAASFPGFMRRIKTDRPFVLEMTWLPCVQVLNNTDLLAGDPSTSALLLTIPSGTAIYQTYTYPRVLYNQFICQGHIRLEPGNTPNKMHLVCTPGESRLFLLGGPEYPDAINNAEHALRVGLAECLQQTRLFWRQYTGARIDFAKLFTPHLPLREKLLQTIDDVDVMLKSQQSRQGAVLAGYPYPLGYVRDQYGVSRGLLALGHYPEAKQILNFYWQIWKKHGVIHNAQAIGLEAVFHIHENDEVESPGCLIMQAFDLFNATNDSTFLHEIFPMLEWAFFAQEKHLLNDMLPFNGDETYIAGGILPRSVLNDGSCEATLLFIESGDRLLSWIAAQKLWPDTTLATNRRVLEKTRQAFKKNFVHDGKLWTNNPQRMLSHELPRFRHGVCEKAGPHCSMRSLHGIIWTERNKNGRYLCPNCLAEGDFPAAPPQSYRLLSVSLTPLYYHSHLQSRQALLSDILQLLEQYTQHGTLHQDNGRSRMVGYDYGFLLEALTFYDHPQAESIYKKALALVDPVGAWAEYYVDDTPNGTRCRPWESAINLEACLHWAETYKK